MCENFIVAELMADKTYNRIEKIQREVGDIITRCGPPPLEKDYSNVERILEKRRPSGCLPRSRSVNMREDRDFSKMGIDSFDRGYVHQLESLSEVEERDVAWIGALQVRYPKSELKLTDKYEGVSDDQLADRYWKGILSEKPSLEYATEKAKVISVENDLSPVRPSSLEAPLKQVAKNGERT